MERRPFGDPLAIRANFQLDVAVQHEAPVLAVAQILHSRSAGPARRELGEHEREVAQDGESHRHTGAADRTKVCRRDVHRNPFDASAP